MDFIVSGNWKLVVGIGGVALASAGVGYLLCKVVHRADDRAVSSLNSEPGAKTYNDGEPLSVYVIEHTNVPAALKKLHKLSSSQPSGKMTTALEQDVLLTMLAKSIDAKAALDIGVFYGCSALALALGVADDGKVIGMDINAERIEKGKPFFAEADVTSKIDIRIKDAEESLAELIANGESGQYDIAFLDVYKVRYPHYINPVCTLLRSGGLFVVDNVLQDGKVVDPTINKEEVQAVRQFNQMLKNDPRFEVVMLKVADGMTIARKL